MAVAVGRSVCLIHSYYLLLTQTQTNTNTDNPIKLSLDKQVAFWSGGGGWGELIVLARFLMGDSGRMLCAGQERTDGDEMGR